MSIVDAEQVALQIYCNAVREIYVTSENDIVGDAKRFCTEVASSFVMT